MEGFEMTNRAEPGANHIAEPGRVTKDSGSQTDSRVQGHDPRLSKVNLYTLLSLWMEMFPQEQPEEGANTHSQVLRVGLVVVKGSQVLGFHCSGPELHAGQAAVLQHGSALAHCHLYFSRRPCATCLKMIINAGVSQISFWPGDPEVSMLRSASENSSNPHSQAPDPQSQAPDPQSQAPHPHSQAPHPHSQAPHPHSQAPHPHSQAPHPHSQAPHPHSQAPHPQSQAPHPHSQAPHPHSQAPDPQSQAPDPQSQAPHPHSQAPHPHSQAPLPHSQAPDPQSQAPHPHSHASNPHSNTPNPHSQAPNPHSQAPHPHSQAPQPHIQVPTPGCITDAAALDAVATETLKSNSGCHMGVRLRPLVPGLAQFVEQTSRDCDFMERVREEEPGLDTDQLFNRERRRHLRDLSGHFLVGRPQQHCTILGHMGLQTLCVEPYFSNLRHNMRALLELLAVVAAGLPQQHHGFYREHHGSSEPPRNDNGLSQQVVRHCIIQARLLAYRTEDPKVGVGAVIWAQRNSAGLAGTGRLYLLGCGYNAYPSGSQYAEYPQLDGKQEDRQRRKYRYIIHAEQNALTFRNGEIRAEESTMLFVTKCPCDECVPLIRGAGVTHIYTSDQDMGKDKGDISYLSFSGLKGINKFIWQRSPSTSPPHRANGSVAKHRQQADREAHSSKRLCTDRAHNSTSVS